MKSILGALGFVLLFSGKCFAQDIILLKTGDEVKALVNEIGVDEIKYKKFENPTGPIYTIEKSKVFMIKYQNGTKDVFNEQSEVKEQKEVVTQPKNQVKAALIYKGNGAISQNDKILSKVECRSILSTNNDALKTYNSGQKLILVGNIVAAGGLGYTIGATLYINSLTKVGLSLSTGTAIAVLGVAVGALATSMAVTISGRHRVKKSSGIV